jgi:AraC family transcriptional regulator
MKVMVIVKATKSSEAGEMPSEQLLAEMGAFNEELAKAGIMLAGEGLHPSSQGARVRFSGKDRTVVDGPFAETKELIAGFWLWQVDSIEDAIAWVKRCPNPHNEDSEIEIRRVFAAEDFGDAFTPQLREQEASVRAQTLGLGEVQFQDQGELVIAGLNETYTNESRVNIPAQWQRFGPHLGSPLQIGQNSYGVCWNVQPGCGFDYLTGIEVADAAALPQDFVLLKIPAQRYAVFTHNGPVSTLPQTIDAIWTKWVPDAGLPIASSPCFERYTEEFDPVAGKGMEIWVPLGS